MPTYEFPQKNNIPNSKESNDWGGYIDIRLDSAGKELFKSWWESYPDEQFNYLIDAGLQGFKCSISWDKENDCWVVAYTGKGVEGDHKRYSLTARAGEVWEAIALLNFKNRIMMEGNWGNYRPNNKYRQNWG